MIRSISDYHFIFFHYLQHLPLTPGFCYFPAVNFCGVCFPYCFNLSRSNALFADVFSTTFFYISNYRTNAFSANFLNASLTFWSSFAEVVIWSMSPSKSRTYFSPYSWETYLNSSPKSLLFPMTMNGKVSGLTTILFYKNESFQFSMLSKLALFDISYTKKQQSAPR